MSEVYEHNPGDHEDPVAGPTWTVGVVGAVMLAVSVLGVTALYYDTVDKQFDAKVAEGEWIERAQLDREQAARLQGPIRYEKRPENQGEVALVVPVELALDRMLVEADE